MTDNETEVLFIQGMPARAKKRFKIMCAREGVSMSEVVVGLIQDAMRGKVKSKLKRKGGSK